MSFTVAFNWKMNSKESDSLALLKDISAIGDINNELIVIPPYVYLSEAKRLLGERFAIGSQDVSVHEMGAYTGEIGAEMLKSMGVFYSLVGHSERRLYGGEVEDDFLRKIAMLEKYNITPIFCFGESLAVRESAGYLELFEKELNVVLSKIKNKIILAYEPVWAIGSGVSIDFEMIEEVFEFALHLVEQMGMSHSVRFLYGGSVNSSNIQDIKEKTGFNGVLVGGASLKKDEILKMA